VTGVEFVSKEGLTQEALFKSCQRVQQMDSQSLMCLDWILASTEYIEFVTMMLEFKVWEHSPSLSLVRPGLDGGRRLIRRGGGGRGRVMRCSC